MSIRPDTLAELEEMSPSIRRLRDVLGAGFEAELAKPVESPPPRKWSGGFTPNRGASRRGSSKRTPSKAQTFLAMTLQTQHEDTDR